MSIFRFKQFEVRNELSAMKVNTDGVLLGASSTLKYSDNTILDIGTGTGTIALMLAQRYSALSAVSQVPDNDSEPADKSFHITGIDIDTPSSREAAANFAGSPWASRLDCINTALQDYIPKEKIDLIISNPPYYEKDLQAPESRRNAARHGDSVLSYEEITAFASNFLAPDGRLSLILPSNRREELVCTAASYCLHPFRILEIRTSGSKPVTRVIVEFSRVAGPIKEEGLIMMEKGRNTVQYNSLISDFYISAN